MDFCKAAIFVSISLILVYTSSFWDVLSFSIFSESYFLTVYNFYSDFLIVVSFSMTYLESNYSLSSVFFEDYLSLSNFCYTSFSIPLIFYYI